MLPRPGALVAFALRVTLGAFVASLTLSPAEAHADDALTPARFALELSGVRYGLFKVEDRGAAAAASPGGSPGPARRLVLVAPELTTPLLALVKTFTRGTAVKNDVRLSSGAIVRTARDAQLFSVRLPVLGAGGPPDVELAFVSPALTSRPLLSARDSSRDGPRVGPRIAGFRVEIASMLPIDGQKLDAVTLVQKANGGTTAGEIAFEVAAGGAPPFMLWQKSSAARPAPRAVRVEYLDGEGSALLRLELDRCTLTSMKAFGASGTTRISLICANVRAE